MKKTRWTAWAAGLVAAAMISPSLSRADETAKTGVVFEEGTPAFADLLAKAKATSKPVFMDFFTEW